MAINGLILVDYMTTHMIIDKKISKINKNILQYDK